MAYTEPTPADLKAKFPAFASVPDATIQSYLTDAASGVDRSWPEMLYAQGKIAKAAHEMALVPGIIEQSEVEAYKAAGIANIRSGNFSASFSESSVAKASGGGLAATPYGRIYKNLLRAAKAGPRLAGGPAIGEGWGPTAQQNDGGILPWAY